MMRWMIGVVGVDGEVEIEVGIGIENPKFYSWKRI